MRSLMFVIAVALMTGCGSPQTKFCKKAGDCDETYDMDTCLDEADEIVEISEELGCPDAATDLMRCYGKHGECSDEGLSTDECADEDLAFVACLFAE